MDCTHDDFLPRLVHFVAKDISRFAEKILGPFGITLEQIQVMRCLKLAETGKLTQREICQSVSKSAANTTRILDRLENKNLIVRQDNPHDRRALLVSLTGRGQALLDEVRDVFESYNASVLKDIPEKDQRMAAAVLRKIAANVADLNVALGRDK